MSRDIRTFFKPLARLANKGVPKVIEFSDEEDVIEDSPVPAALRKKTPNKKIESPSKSKSKNKGVPIKKSPLKPVSVWDLLSSAPVKQSRVVDKANNEEKRKKQEEDFNKTLQQLDDIDDLTDIDANELDRTFQEAEAQSKSRSKPKTTTKNNAKTSTPSSRTPNRKRKAEDLDESGLDPDQERYEKEQQRSIAYQKFKNRGSPPNKGIKEMPVGTKNCLRDLCFLKTGVLDSLDSESLKELVVQYGARTVKAVSGKVNYLIVGKEPGVAKLKKGRSMGIKEITEDELLDMILINSGKPARYCKNNNESEDVIDINGPEKKKIKTSHKTATSPSAERENLVKNDVTVPKMREKEKLEQSTKSLSTSNEKLSELSLRSSPRKVGSASSQELSGWTLRSSPKKISQSASTASQELKTSKTKPVQSTSRAVSQRKNIPDENKSWTEKYKPTDLKSVVGQQDNSEKLMKWLTNWNQNHIGKNKPKLTRPSPWEKNDDGMFYKCALLSGPPGVGKTTVATLVAKELGYDIVEFNASDTRNKKVLHEEVSQLLSSKSIATYFKDGSAPTTKHVLLMDEVDGMSGNQDRGGVQELITLIKNSSIPIICMCNDRQHPKIRSLVNYCFDLRFNKPTIQQIRGRMSTVCFKEELKIEPSDLVEIITSTGFDIRQTLNHLAMWSVSDKHISGDLVKKETESSQKDKVLGHWEVVRKVFSAKDHESMSIADKSKLFFYDYSIGPLFVQENYLQVQPHCSEKKLLQRVALAADTISMGDVIESKIRSTNNWSMMENQAFHSSVLPGHYMAGHFKGQINFPGWLGKNSKRGKFNRLACELQSHMRLSTGASKEAVNLDYIYHLRRNILNPLIKSGAEGIEEASQVMKVYGLLREDLDSILELTLWANKKDPWNRVDSRVKAKFTRAYNKNAPAMPYSFKTAVAKKKSTAAVQDSPDGEGGEEQYESERDDNDDDDITNNAMIKQKKKPTKKDAREASTSKKPASKSGKAKKPK